MPKIIDDPSQKRVSCNISLPLDFITMLDDYTKSLKQTFGESLPKTFCRSDVVRVLVDRYFYTPYRTHSGKRISLSKSDDNFIMLSLDIALEYGLVEPDQIEIDFDALEDENTDKEEKENA